jgi:hypothetical protein
MKSRRLAVPVAANSIKEGEYAAKYCISPSVLLGFKKYNAQYIFSLNKPRQPLRPVSHAINQKR